MRSLLALFLLALPLTAGADSSYMLEPTLQGFGGKRPVFSFTAPAAGAYASLTMTGGQTITCSSGAGTYIDGSGVRQTSGVNTCRVGTDFTPDGQPWLLSEAAATQSLASPTSPATQTTASLGTGSFTGWMEGTGSVAFTVGSAVATGLPCTATTGATHDCHFSITSAGTITATVSGTVTLEQLTNTKWRHAAILSATTRAADVIGIAAGSNPIASLNNNWCIALKMAPYNGVTWTATGIMGFASMGNPNSTNSFFFGASSAGNVGSGACGIDGSDGVARAPNNSFAMPAATTTATMCSANGAPSIYLNGSLQALVWNNPSGTGQFGAYDVLELGNIHGANTLDGYISSIYVCKSHAGSCL